MDQYEAENERLVDALGQIEDWIIAYPRTVFIPVGPEQMQRAAVVLKEAGISVDAMHAEWARHILDTIGGIVQAALAG